MTFHVDEKRDMFGGRKNPARTTARISVQTVISFNVPCSLLLQNEIRSKAFAAGVRLQWRVRCLELLMTEDGKKGDWMNRILEQDTL